MPGGILLSCLGVDQSDSAEEGQSGKVVLVHGLPKAGHGRGLDHE